MENSKLQILGGAGRVQEEDWDRRVYKAILALSVNVPSFFPLNMYSYITFIINSFKKGTNLGIRLENKL